MTSTNERVLPSSVAARAAKPAPIRMTGAQAVVRSLEELGADSVFGLLGGAILPIYDALFDSQKVRHILVRHEQGAGHAAEGYASVSGRVGVAMVTSGPGATNLTTAIADAYMDSVPLVAITGQVNAPLIGTDAFQEADIVGATMPIVKHSFLIKDGAEIPERMAEAFHIASTGRPGPVLVDIAKSAQNQQIDFSWPPRMNLPGYRPITRPHSRQVREAARLLATASRPVLYVGGGAIRSGAAEVLRTLVDLSGAAVVTTLMARGAVPDSHPQHCGMPGMHGSVAAVAAMQRADLLIALGARFDDRVTGDLKTFAPGAVVVHADIDPAEISKNRRADVPIVGDLKQTIAELNVALSAAHEQYGKPDLGAWWRQLDELRSTYPLGWTDTEDGRMAPQHVIKRLGEIVGPDGVYVSGVGQHQMWAAQFIRYERPNAWLNSGGLGTMGYSIPAAMGAKVGAPDREVWSVDGDGSFQMTNQELATCVLNDIPIKVALINNSALGMVRQWQTLFYDGRYSHTELETGYGSRNVPDFVKLADAYGAVGLRCESVKCVDETIAKAREIDDVPVVIDFVVSRDAMVWPMVPAGLSNDQIQYARGLTPDFSTDD